MPIFSNSSSTTTLRWPLLPFMNAAKVGCLSLFLKGPAGCHNRCDRADIALQTSLE